MRKNNELIIYFAYTKPKNYSGQTWASELIIESLNDSGIKCIPILLYPLTRTLQNKVLGYFQLLIRQLKTIPNIISLLFSRKPILHLNLGQSYWSFVRVGLWYFPTRIFNRGMKVVTSLHGSNFMKWESEAFITWIFMRFLESSKIVTVLGDNQKRKLIQLGLKPERIRVVPNACNLSPVEDSFIEEKHSDSDLPVRLLHLSLLIESKGFPLYLEALELLAVRNIERPVQAVLCGPLTFSPYCKQFKSVDDKTKWIKRKLEAINRNSNGLITAEWIPGASGKIKQKLYEDSHIFVFPTSFPVEAQPIVLIEALATGCSIITTTAGEIPSTLNTDCATLMDGMDSKMLADEIYRLIVHPEVRTAMALNGIKLIRGRLSLGSHLSIWNQIFDEMKN